jgi:hypothetical protein
LEAYQKNFIDFVYGIPTSIKALGQDEETEVGPNGTVREEECKLRNHKTSKVEQLEEKIYIKKPQDFKGGG